MKPKVVAIIPGRNEEDVIENTITSIRNQKVDSKIIVVNDGSSDKTGEIAEKFADLTVHRKDRGFSGLGSLNLLAHTTNAGFAKIPEVMPDYEYVFVLGCGDYLAESYIPTIIQRMKDENVSVAGGISYYEQHTINIRGSGRLIERKFWEHFGEKYPANPIWEDYIGYYAPAYGFRSKIYRDMMIYPTRETWKKHPVNMYNIGVAASTLGLSFYYVIFKAFRFFFITKNMASFTTFMKGYKANKYEIDERVKLYIKLQQFHRITQIIKLFLKKYSFRK